MVVDEFTTIMNKTMGQCREAWTKKRWASNECYLWEPHNAHIISLAPRNASTSVVRIDLYDVYMDVWIATTDGAHRETIRYDIEDDAFFQLSLVHDIGNIDKQFFKTCIKFRNYMINYK